MLPLYHSGFSFSDEGGLPVLTCPALTFPHAFSTRLGGVSRGEGLDTLDLGMGDPAQVNENRRRFALRIGADPSHLITARQIHSPTVCTVTADDIGRDFLCDGFVTDTPGLLLTVKTADCVPILLSDPVHRVIGAVHAGWRGTVAGIAEEAVKAMLALDAERETMIAAVGPCIHADCYEVDEPFVAAVGASPCGAELLPYISTDRESGRLAADLPQMNLRLLLNAGLRPERLFVSGFCTSCASRLFYSHRASGGKRGLQMAGILLPER